MNKTYLKPTIEVMHLEVHPLMQNSIQTINGIDGVTPSGTEFTGGEADSRRNNLWDDYDNDFNAWSEY